MPRAFLFHSMSAIWQCWSLEVNKAPYRWNKQILWHEGGEERGKVGVKWKPSKDKWGRSLNPYWTPILMITRYIPRWFKCSYTVPIPKMKNFHSRALTCDDFRGIAISPVLSKVFEYCFLERYQSLLTSSGNQFGFRKGLGCRNAIHICVT